MIILTPSTLINNKIYHHITQIIPVIWMSCNILLVLYWFKVSKWYQYPIDIQENIYLTNVAIWDEYVIDAINDKQHRLEGDFLIIQDKIKDKKYYKIPISNIKQIEYSYKYNDKEIDTIENWIKFGMIRTIKGIFLKLKKIIYPPNTIKGEIKNL